MSVIKVSGSVTLGQLLKVAGVARSGGAAKHLVRAGKVRVNGAVETRRGRKMSPGDVVEVDGRELIVAGE